MLEKNNQYSKWVACWGNATSITDQKEAMYAKNLTLRYPIRMCFSGNKLRFHFSNLTGTEPITLSEVYVAAATSDSKIDESSQKPILFQGKQTGTIAPGQELVSDEVAFAVQAGMTVAVSIYLEEYTQMNAGVLITGPLSKGFYTYGSYAGKGELPIDLTRNTSWFYFLNTVDILTEEKNHALICYGDSITAQDWPDYLSLRAWEEGFHDISIIRRAVSGTRILRQYDCTTYAAYGLKGETRFPIEMQTAGADRVLIQHGINDIIHPVGSEVNVFRPMSDMPTVEELMEGVRELYVKHARELGMKVWIGTLLPIYGWRTYAPFREEVKCRFNDWMRTSGEFDGCVDFDRALCDPSYPEKFAEGYDSGDHLHPSALAYKRMAEEIPEELLR